MVNELTNENFNDVISSNDLVLLQVSTSWCNPCKILTPIVEEASNEVSNVFFAKVDAEKNTELASNLNIRSVPTVIILKEGLEVERFTGVKTKKDIMNLIEDYI